MIAPATMYVTQSPPSGSSCQNAPVISKGQKDIAQLKHKIGLWIADRISSVKGTGKCTLTAAERKDLAETLRKLPQGTTIENIGYHLAKVEKNTSTDPNAPKVKISPEPSMGSLGIKFNLNQVETNPDQFPTSVCGGKRPVTYHRYDIQKPGEKKEEVYGISDAVMFISDSPIHSHSLTEERYTALAPVDEHGKELVEPGYKKEKPIALMYLEDPKTRKYEIHPVYVGDTFVLKPGLIHGSTSVQGTSTKWHLQFSPGLVERPGTGDKATDELRTKYRDESLMYPSTLKRIKSLVKTKAAA